MTYLNVDTEKLVAVGIELQEIAKELTILSNDMFSKLSNVSTNGVWNSGDVNGSANLFVNAVAKDKEKINKYEVSLDKLGEQISNYGKNLQYTSNAEM